MDSVWKIEPELQIPTPRPVARRAVRVPRFAPGCFVAIFGLVALGVWISLLSQLLLFALGDWTSGTVTSKTFKHGSKSDTYTVFYAFDGFKSQANINRASYDGWRVGDHFGVKFYARNSRDDDEKPVHLAFLTRGLGIFWPQLDWLFLLIWASFISFFVASWLREAFGEPRKQRFLVQNGVAVMGNVNKIEQSSKNPTISARYTFHDANGNQHRGSVSVPLQTEAKTGSATVLYDGQNARRHTLYRFAQWEVMP